jgi:hypothetical protein
MIGAIGCAEPSHAPEPPAKQAAVPEEREREETPVSTSPVNVAPCVSMKPRNEGDPVAVLLEVSDCQLSTGETFTVSVVFDIGSVYEIHDLHAPPPLIATRLNLELPKGFQALGDWSAPGSIRSESPDGHPVYAGKAKFTREIRVQEDVEPRESDVTCSIRYQACNARHCLAPKELKISAAVSVSRK